MDSMMKKARMDVLKHLSKQMHARRFGKPVDDEEDEALESPEEEAHESPAEEAAEEQGEGDELGLDDEDDMDGHEHDGTLSPAEKKTFMKKGRADVTPPKRSMTVVMQRAVPASFKGHAKRK